MGMWPSGLPIYSLRKRFDVKYEVLDIDEYEFGIVVFDENLVSNEKATFIGGWHKILDEYYLSQFCFDLPKE